MVDFPRSSPLPAPLKAGTCIACGGPLESFGPRFQYHYSRCTDCYSLQLFPMPDAQEMARAYAERYIAAKQHPVFVDPKAWAASSVPYRRSITATLRKHGCRGVVVDFGAGWGFLVETLRENGFEARGVDLSQDEVSYAQSRGLPVELGGLERLSHLEGTVDAIVMIAVFEHLVDHPGVLRAARSLLKKDGIIVTLHPTARLFTLLGRLLRLGNQDRELPQLDGSFTAPWHTALLSIKGTRSIFERNGFRSIEVMPAPQGRYPGWPGLTQRILGWVNRIGWPIFRERWPLLTSHVFVFGKSSSW